MQSLIDITQTCKTNSPEWLEIMQEELINPMLEQGAIFLGYSAMQAPENPGTREQQGIHILAFEEPKDKKCNIPYFQDEGTNSFAINWCGQIHIIIPIPY